MNGVVALTSIEAEADRGGAVERAEVGRDGVFEVEAAVEQLVGLAVVARVAGAGGRVVVVFGEEPRGAQHDAGQAVQAAGEAAEVFGGGLVAP
ncbi:MAG: hypothetical protein R3F65_31015 [bacterium]